MKIIDLSKNYQRLFHFKGIDFLMDDIQISFYKNLDALITAINDDRYVWLPKEIFDEQMNEGVGFFADAEKFKSYYNAHTKYLDNFCSTFISEIKNNEILSRENVEKFLELARQSLSFFYKTEFFYTDKAYQFSESDTVIKENLEKHYKLKEKSRVILFNESWFGENSYLSQMRGKLSNQFNVPKDDLKYYSIDEIYSLFEGEKLSNEVVRERKEARIIIAENKEVKVHTGLEVKKEIIDLLKQTGEEIPQEAKILKGIPASKGRVVGKVKIIISDPKTFDSLAKEIDKMERGDILVAETTSPEFMPACEKAGAILANQGGLLSHAAVVSREFGIPCIVGLRFATKVLKDGDEVEVDADRGIVKIIKNG